MMMSNAKVDLSDTDMIADADDQWDDFIDEDSSFEDQTSKLGSDRKPAIQSNKIIKLLLLFLLLSGGAYAAILFFKNSSKNNIPVVKIDNIKDSNSLSQVYKINEQVNDDNNLISDQNLSPEVYSVIPDIVDENKIVIPNEQHEQNVDSNIGVLTPMPDNFNNDIILSSLESDNISDQNYSEIEGNKQPLLEDKLLHQTEVVFEDTSEVNSRIENNSILVEETTAIALEVEDVAKNNKLPEQLETIISEEAIIPSPVVKPVTNVTSQKALVKSSKKIVQKNNWVIRAAQSESAVIYNKLSGEMKTIEVNDFVSGIGRVKSIKKIDSKWRIVGKSGVIK